MICTDIDDPSDCEEFADHIVMQKHELYDGVPMPFVIISYHDAEPLSDMPKVSHNRAGHAYKPSDITKSPWVNPQGWRAIKKLDLSWTSPEDVVKHFAD